MMILHMPMYIPYYASIDFFLPCHWGLSLICNYCSFPYKFHIISCTIDINQVLVMIFSIRTNINLENWKHGSIYGKKSDNDTCLWKYTLSKDCDCLLKSIQPSLTWFFYLSSYPHSPLIIPLHNSMLSLWYSPFKTSSSYNCALLGVACSCNCIDL